jgi:hypothetical protein
VERLITFWRSVGMRHGAHTWKCATS